MQKLKFTNYLITGWAMLFLSMTGLWASPKRTDFYQILRFNNADRDSIQKEAPPRIISAQRMAAYKAGINLTEGKRTSKSKALDAMDHFLEALGSECKQSQNQNKMVQCLKFDTKDQDILFRLSLWQITQLAIELNYLTLLDHLIQNMDFTSNDPLNQEIYELILKQLSDSDSAQALTLANSNLHIQSPMVRLWRGRVLAKNKDLGNAARYLLTSAATTDAYWIQRAALVELRKYFGNDLSADSLPSRDLTMVASQMNSTDLKNLKNKLSITEILKSGKPELVESDGIFLIRSGQHNHIKRLAKQTYTHVSRNPQTLLKWASLLQAKSAHNTSISLLKDFEHTITQSPALWKIYIQALYKTGQKIQYFNEIIRYLNKYPSHYDMQDLLIEVLIGNNPDKNVWAHSSYWTKSRQYLPHHTGNGRFIYWLSNYYKHTGQHKQLQILEDTFYHHAPGSFYAGAFWDNRPKNSDFIDDWRKVNNRYEYLIWLSKHGGNRAAIQYLNHHNFTQYLDPDAIKITKELQAAESSVSSDITFIFSMGHKKLGHDYLDQYDSNDIGKFERYKRLAHVGIQTDNLEYSVYYSRQFARELGISEDPFSMPEWLLKVLYPQPFEQDVKKYAKEYDVETEAIYAIMRQESLFRTNAVSRSGARGLMQIMPRTGSWLADKLKIKNYDPHDTSQNIQMGSKFFADLIRSYDDFRWAAIAYNGGPGNLRKWKGQYYKGDLYHFLEHLPKEESRNYCRITYQNYMHYKTTYLLYP